MSQKFSSLRVRVLLLVALPFAVMLAMIVHETIDDRAQRLADARAQLMRTTELLAARQQRILERARQILLSVALLPEIRGAIAPETCSRALASKVREGGIFVNMLVARPDGRAICNAIGVERPIDIGDRDFFRRALRTHDVEVGGYIVSRSTGKPAIGIAYPLLDAAGDPQVVVSATIDLGWLAQALKEAALPRGSRLAIAGGRGTILACQPDCADRVGKPAAQSPAYRAILAAGGKGTAEELGLDGVRRVVAFAPLYRATTGQTYIWIGVPKHAVVGPVERKLKHALLVELGLLALTFAAFWLGSRRLFLVPLARLADAAGKLGTGDLSARSRDDGAAGEIAEVARAFDRMAEGLDAKDRQLRRSNRALRMISAANQTMLRARDEAQLVDAFCRALVETGGYRMAWIGYAQNDARRSIRPDARAGAGAERFFEGLELTWGEDGPGQTPPARAIRGGVPVVVQDIARQAGPEPWRGNALRAGCGSCVALPLRVDTNVIGVLAIYAQEERAFDEEEVTLLAEAAGDLSYGVAALRGVAEQAPLRHALRTAEDRLRSAVDANLDALLVLESVRDAQGAIVDFELDDLNRAAERLLGAPRERVLGGKLSKLLPESRRWGMFDKYVQVADSGAPLEEEFPIGAAAGAVRWLRQQVVRVGNGIAVSSRDVTAWKTAGERLRESSARLDLALRSAGMGVWAWDIVNDRRQFDAQVCGLLGIEPAKFTGTAEEFFAVVHPEDREAIKAALAATIDHDALYEPEYRVVWPEGMVRHVAARGRLVRDEQGRPARIDGVLWDVTERRRAQEALRRSERGLKDAQRIAHLGNWEFDLVGGALAWTDEVYHIFEIAPGGPPPTYQIFLNAVHPEDRELVDKAYTESVKNRSGYDLVHRLLMSDGRVKYVHERCETRYDADGRPLRSVGTVQDITERKRGELALERANRALRTLSACNEALIHATSEAELLDAICRIAVETGGYAAAWVGFPEQDAAKTVRAVAQFGIAGDYLASAQGTWDDTERGRGPTGTAMRSGATQVNQNSRANPAMAPWRDAALERGFLSSIALPLKGAAGVLGALTLYAQAVDAFDPNEVRLLEELAADLAFGLNALRTRAERDRIAYEHRHHAEILRQSLEDSIKAIATTVELRDPYTAGHERRVAQLAVAIAREVKLPEETVHGIELAASIHDLGKINVPAEILAKPTRLSDIELALVKNHAQAGYDILKGIRFPWPIAAMVLQHHERLDGTGYPQGLKDGQILPESRILAVADVVEAMASHRPYRAALGIERALQEIERGRGTAYDAAVVDACLKLFAEHRFAFSD